MSKDPYKNPWKCKSTQIIYENPWIKVEEDQVIRPNGSEGIYSNGDYQVLVQLSDGLEEHPLAPGIWTLKFYDGLGRFDLWLTDQNIPRNNLLVTETLHPKALGLGITSITAAAACFLMCHCKILKSFYLLLLPIAGRSKGGDGVESSLHAF